MKGYEKLIEALRCPRKMSINKYSCEGCEFLIEYGELDNGFCACDIAEMAERAADAIEELQTKLGEQIELQTKEQGVLLDRIAELEQQLPKRGEWVEDTTTYSGPGLSNYKCSMCGKICGTWRSGLKHDELPNWCGNCGADMRKMGVQE